MHTHTQIRKGDAKYITLTRTNSAKANGGRLTVANMSKLLANGYSYTNTPIQTNSDSVSVRVRCSKYYHNLCRLSQLLELPCARCSVAKWCAHRIRQSVHHLSPHTHTHTPHTFAHAIRNRRTHNNTDHMQCIRAYVYCEPHTHTSTHESSPPSALLHTTYIVYVQYDSPIQ